MREKMNQCRMLSRMLCISLCRKSTPADCADIR
jgi:hypothetical protein